MNRNDQAGVAGADGLVKEAAEILRAAVQVRENLAATREDAVHSREEAVDVREGVASSRENALDSREDAATSREEEIHVGQTLLVATDDYMRTLQQANAHLVIATLDAQRLAQEVQAAKAQLEISKSLAETANRAKSDFLSSMSHELRTPLNTILGFAQLLEAGSPPPTPIQKGRIDKILGAGWYLLEMINEILDLAMIESGKLSMSLEPVSLSEVMLDCQSMMEIQAEKSGIRMSFPRFDRPCLVRADRTRLKQIIINLLSNAIKYNRAGGLVEVACSTNAAGRLRISVTDSGEGLATEQLAQLFQAFNRLGQEASTVEGAGIGLVVSKRLVEMMGGSIGVESTVGVGSVFWIELA
jgi:signal transduction histidine kinase